MSADRAGGGLLRRAFHKAVELAFPSPLPRTEPPRGAAFREERAKKEAAAREAAAKDAAARRQRPPPPPAHVPPPRTKVEPNDEAVKAPLATVLDPEVGIDIVNLGLLRGWTVDGDKLHLRITATSPACPVGPAIVDAAQEALAAAFPDYACTAELVWEPAWTPDDMTDRARAWLGHGPPPSEPEEKTMEKTLDIRPIAPRERHPLIFQTFDALARGVGFVLVNDHDPKPLYYQFQAEYGQVFGWEYLERGPETWKVRISRVA